MRRDYVSVALGEQPEPREYNRGCRCRSRNCHDRAAQTNRLYRRYRDESANRLGRGFKLGKLGFRQRRFEDARFRRRIERVSVICFYYMLIPHNLLTCPSCE
jgi:hypothetical protein